LTLDNDALGKARWGGVQGGSLYKIAGNLIWKRRDYWQGTLTPITIYNSNETVINDPISIYNHNDGGGSAGAYHLNYFDIAGTSIINADMPSPIKLAFWGVGIYLKSIYIGCNTYDDSGIYQEFNTGGTATAAADRSGGTVMSCALSNTYQLFYSASTTGYYPTFGGVPAGVLIGFGGTVLSGTYGYLYEHYSEFQSDEFLLSDSSELQLVGVYSSRPVSATQVRMYLKNANGGTIRLDTLSAIPMTNYVRINPEGTLVKSIPYRYLIYDSSSVKGEESYFSQSAATTIGDCIVENYGSGIYLEPGKDTRFTFQWLGSGGTIPISDVMDTWCYYYPRRRVL